MGKVSGRARWEAGRPPVPWIASELARGLIDRDDAEEPGLGIAFLWLVAAAALARGLEAGLAEHFEGSLPLLFGLLACALWPLVMAIGRLQEAELGESDGRSPTAPVWAGLSACALVGVWFDDSWVAAAILAVCLTVGAVQLLFGLRCFRRRAMIAEQIARGRLLTDPWDTEWYGKLADALLAQGKRREALQALQRWRVRDPWSCEPQRRIAAVRG